ncbi:MAG: diguanylate cyclase domain-containing protein [Huintestinicola sp.]|uniref:diguanylate cyclase domain-containing protein n=1 Tax=Huintestinicola sp. TaxID=2981661 RepID=UPI003F03EC76
MKIRFKLAGLMLIILIIPMIVVSSVYSSKSADAIVKGQINSLGIINGDRAAYLNEFIGNIILSQKSFTSDNGVREFVEHECSDAHSDDELKYVNELIRDTVRRSSAVTDMFILNDRGVILAAYKTDMIGQTDSQVNDYISFSGSNSGISGIYPPNSSDKCYFYSCRRVYTPGNKKVGVAVQKVSLEEAAEMLKITGYSNFAVSLIVDSNGKYISGSVSNPRKLEDVVEFRAIAESIPEAIPYYGDTNGSDTVIKENEGYHIFGTPVSNGGWSVVSMFESVDAKKAASDSVSGVRVAVIIITILAAAAIILVCYFFTEPIKKLVSVIYQKNKGDVNVRLDLDSNDEFGQISTEFNAMFDSIFESEQRYRTVVSMMDNVVFEINLKTFKVYVSNNFNQKFSYRAKDDSISESFFYKMKIHKDDMKRYKEDLDTIVSSQGDKWEGEYRMKNLYGDFSWIRVKGKKFFDRSGAPSKIIGLLVDIDKEKKSAITLIQKASFDALTQLYNRPTFLRTLDEEMNASSTRRSLDALMFIDLDDFKHFNDEYGHKCGDEVLKFVADTIKEVTYERGFGGRLGGDEFVMCLTNLTLIGDAGKVAAEVISILNEGFVSESTELHFNIHCSIGIAFFRENGSNSAELLEAADTAMYKIKKSGKSNFAYAGGETRIDIVETTATFDSTF